MKVLPAVPPCLRFPEGISSFLLLTSRSVMSYSRAVKGGRLSGRQKDRACILSREADFTPCRFSSGRRNLGRQRCQEDRAECSLLKFPVRHVTRLRWLLAWLAWGDREGCVGT